MDRAGTGSIALSRAFAVLAGVVWVLLVFGGSVRVHGAGLACPDWPLCFGEAVPTLNFEVFLEWGHRVLASLVSFAFLGLAALAWRRRALRLHLMVAALVLAMQVILGGLTVLHLLAYWSVTLHLLTGNLFMVLIALLAVRLAPAPAENPMPRAAQRIAVALVAALVVQMALGGLVSSNLAGLACTEWPTCNGGVWFPVFDGIVGLHLVHRLGAYTLLAVSAAFWAVTGRRLVFALVLAQGALGVANVLLAMPVEVAILHSALADLVVLATTVAVFGVLRQPQMLRGRKTDPRWVSVEAK